MPLMVGVLIAVGIGLLLNRKEKGKTTFEEKVDIFCKGGGEHTLVQIILIYILEEIFQEGLNDFYEKIQHYTS